MNAHFKSVILQSTGASGLREKEVIQSLWSGYGKILRVDLEGAEMDSVVVKHVQMPSQKRHPRGWNSDLGHRRKIKSYQVETTWYKDYAPQSKARLPKCLALEQSDEEVLMVLEDLDQAGYPLRKTAVNWQDIEACLAWLASFHASYLDKAPEGLWEVGTYWHLATRPQELAVLADQKLRAAATEIDDKLNNCQFKTFVHGDAKLANFCFAANGARTLHGAVAAVDFQYVGGGCGMKDLAYFVGSCLDERDCERYEKQILDTYFKYLQASLDAPNADLEKEWRSLYRVAWADFHRFIKGWSPGHWKINSYSERISAEVINTL